MTNMISKPSLTETIKAIGPGKNAEIPVGMFTHASVRNRACNLGLEMDRTYHVHLNRERGVYIVEREK
jgi:hypothetical protein